jgi:CheY-like chemotaxis protein
MNAEATVLVAEDEPTDALILRLAFEAAGLANPLTIVSDGRTAVDYLSGIPPYDDRTAHPLPALLVLDLKMPRMNGFDVLTWLRAHPDFNALPAVVLSSSSADEDIERARSLGARDYFVKPYSLDDLIAILHRLREQWLTRPPA